LCECPSYRHWEALEEEITDKRINIKRLVVHVDALSQDESWTNETKTAMMVLDAIALNPTLSSLRFKANYGMM